MKHIIVITAIISATLTGCANIEMASKQEDQSAKTFSPSQEEANIYIYRNSWVGMNVRQRAYFDGKELGVLKDETFYVMKAKPGKHRVETESEFSNNGIDIDVKGGENIYVRQYIKLGLLFSGANVELVTDEKEAQEDILDSEMLMPKG